MSDFDISDVGDYLDPRFALDPANLLGMRESAGEKAAKENAARFAKDVQVPNLPELSLRRHLESLSPTELAKIQENPALLQAQMGALGKLEEITAGSGLSAADRGRIGQIGREEAIAEKGQRGALMQNAQARGLGGSGLETASLLNAQQGTANRQANRDIDVENLAQQRALQAIESQGRLSGDIRSQDYTKASNAAQAQDIINRFNNQTRNTARTAELTYNAGLPQQRFDNALTYQAGLSGYNTAAAGQTDARQGRLSDTLGTAAQVVGSIYGGPIGGAAGTMVKGAISPEEEKRRTTAGQM